MNSIKDSVVKGFLSKYHFEVTHKNIQRLKAYPWNSFLKIFFRRQPCEEPLVELLITLKLISLDFLTV